MKLAELREKQRQTVINALIVAAERYEDNIQVIHADATLGTVPKQRLIDQFRLQAEEARQLAIEMEDA